MILVALLIALLPVWRLHVAGWPMRSLLIAWVLYSAGVFAVLRLPGLRLLVPILVLAYVAPFVAGPERLSRVLNGRSRGGVVIDVTPRPAPGLPEPGDEEDAAGDVRGPRS